MSTVTIEIDDDAFGNVAMLRKLAPGEPYYIIRGQDKLGAGTIRFWANEAEKVGVSDDKVANARKVAHAMMQWPKRKMPD
jgi:hypothetical protein